MRVYFYAGERPSEGLVNLRNALRAVGHNCLRLRARGSQFTARRNRVIINWGCTDNEWGRQGRPDCRFRPLLQNKAW